MCLGDDGDGDGECDGIDGSGGSGGCANVSGRTLPLPLPIFFTFIRLTQFKINYIINNLLKC